MKYIAFSKMDHIGAKVERFTFKKYIAHTNTEEFKSQISLVRSGSAKKQSLPVIIPAGIFKGGFLVSCLQTLNGYASFDIDKIENIDEVEKQVHEIPYVVFCERSASGNGLWGLVRFENPNAYLYHYSALIEYFDKQGIELDKTSANINRLRYMSWSENRYFNFDAPIFKSQSMTIPTRDGKNTDFFIQHDYEFTRLEWSRIKRFNTNMQCSDILEMNDWTFTGFKADGQEDYLRPGSDKSTSGNIKNNRFWCFTGSTNLKEMGLHTPFDLIVFLNCNGDVKQALREIRSI